VFFPLGDKDRYRWCLRDLTARCACRNSAQGNLAERSWVPGADRRTSILGNGGYLEENWERKNRHHGGRHQNAAPGTQRFMVWLMG